MRHLGGFRWVMGRRLPSQHWLRDMRRVRTESGRCARQCILGGRERQTISIDDLDIMDIIHLHLYAYTLHITRPWFTTKVPRTSTCLICIALCISYYHEHERSYINTTLQTSRLLASVSQSSMWLSPLPPFTSRIAKCRSRNPMNTPYTLSVFPAGNK